MAKKKRISRQARDQFDRVIRFAYDCNPSVIDILDLETSGIYAYVGPYCIKCDLLDMLRYRKAKAWFDRESSEGLSKQLLTRWQKFCQRYVIHVLGMVDAGDVNIRLTSTRRRR